MASSSLTVETKSGVIRKYGGTRGSVKSLWVRYVEMSKNDFLDYHKHLNLDDDDFYTLRLTRRFNKS
jgi:hypothetical protein